MRYLNNGDTEIFNETFCRGYCDPYHYKNLAYLPNQEILTSSSCEKVDSSTIDCYDIAYKSLLGGTYNCKNC